MSLANQVGLVGRQYDSRRRVFVTLLAFNVCQHVDDVVVRLAISYRVQQNEAGHVAVIALQLLPQYTVHSTVHSTQYTTVTRHNHTLAASFEAQRKHPASHFLKSSELASITYQITFLAHGSRTSEGSATRRISRPMDRYVTVVVCSTVLYFNPTACMAYKHAIGYLNFIVETHAKSKSIIDIVNES